MVKVVYKKISGVLMSPADLKLELVLFYEGPLITLTCWERGICLALFQTCLHFPAIVFWGAHRQMSQGQTSSSCYQTAAYSEVSWKQMGSVTGCHLCLHPRNLNNLVIMWHHYSPALPHLMWIMILIPESTDRKRV